MIDKVLNMSLPRNYCGIDHSLNYRWIKDGWKQITDVNAKAEGNADSVQAIVSVSLANHNWAKDE